MNYFLKRRELFIPGAVYKVDTEPTTKYTMRDKAYPLRYTDSIPHKEGMVVVQSEISDAPPGTWARGDIEIATNQLVVLIEPYVADSKSDFFYSKVVINKVLYWVSAGIVKPENILK